MTSTELRRWLLRAALAIAGALTVLGLAFAWLYLHNARATRAFAAQEAPGVRMVDAAGVRLAARVRGAGRPAIVIEAGLSPSAEWWPLVDALARHTQVVSYDRAGSGGSDESERPRTAQNIALELRELLRALGVEPPVIVIGESIGALYAQGFARAYPEQVAGLVLVHPITTEHGRYQEELQRAVYQNLINLTPRIQGAALLAQLGVMRLLGALPYGGVVPHDVARMRELYAAEKTYRAMLAEYRKLGQSVQEVQALGGLPPVPLYVLHACSRCWARELQGFRMAYDEAKAVTELSERLARATAALSPHGRMRMAQRAVRYLHVVEPEQVEATARQVLSAARASSALQRE